MTRRTARRPSPAAPSARATIPAAPLARRAPAWIWIFAVVLAAATLVAYQPAWHGTRLWDDDAHLTAPGMRDAGGLGRIWSDIGATQQYYPVVHSAFWIFARLWGDAVLGYHLANILLHATSAVLLLVILRRLGVAGGVLAATTFALHPIQVESVAWMTELKNTLSTVFYLSSALVYLRFDESRARGAYAASLLLFALALLSKTVTATLPGALLVVLWWKRGTLTWRHDVRPLLPFFVLGLAGGLTTAWFERVLLGARGAEYSLGLVERGLLAARALCFYAGKLIWPRGLTFIYPRWTITASSSGAYLYVAAVLAVVASCWIVRSRSRAPLAIGLLFGGALIPALGFVNVYPFRYSYVADHFAYLATIPAFAGFGAATAGALSKVRGGRGPELVLAASCALVLGVLTWRQAHVYRDSETLYRETLARNPECWLCFNNLAEVRLQGSDAELKEAVTYLREALRINPLAAEVHNNYAVALQREGRLDDALRAYEEASRLDPGFVEVRYNIGVLHQSAGRLTAAVKTYQVVIGRRPDHGPAHYNLGTVLARQGRIDEALRHFREAARLQRSDWLAHATLGKVLLDLGRVEEAIAAQRMALAVAPASEDVRAGTRADLGTALASAGRIEEAMAEFREAVKLDPERVEAWTTLGLLAAETGELGEAEIAFRRVLQASPDAAAHDNLALVLLRQRRTDEAVHHLREAIQLDPAFAPAHQHLGVALGMLGRTNDAIDALARAVRLAPESPDAHNDFGAALLEIGRRGEAIAHFEAALRLQPGHQGAQQNLARSRDARR